MDRLAKRHRVDRDGDARRARVAHRADGSRLVHDAHDDAAVNVAESVAVLREHQLVQGDARVSGGFGAVHR